jgi:hypothetical protein
LRIAEVTIPVGRAKASWFVRQQDRASASVWARLWLILARRRFVGRSPWPPRDSAAAKIAAQ